MSWDGHGSVGASFFSALVVQWKGPRRRVGGPLLYSRRVLVVQCGEGGGVLSYSGRVFVMLNWLCSCSCRLQNKLLCS